MSREELLKKIQELSFAKTETELFLDTHPDCNLALEYYRKIIGELDVAMAEYQGTYGPLVAEASSMDKWDWVSSPWPWQNCGMVELNCRGQRRE